METSVELDCAASHFADAGNVLYPLRYLIPRRIVLVGWRISRRLDGFESGDERVQLNDLAVTLQHVNRELARNEARDGRYLRKCRLLFHHLGGLYDCSSTLWCFFDVFEVFSFGSSRDLAKSRSSAAGIKC